MKITLHGLMCTFFFAVGIAHAQDFVLKSDAPFTAVQYSSATFADVDADGDEDVFISGADGGYSLTARLYLNDGIGNFAFLDNPVFKGVREGRSAFADVDGDGDPDLLVTGYEESGPGTASIYINDGAGIFTISNNQDITGSYNNAVAFADIDNDADMDLLISGRDAGEVSTMLYRNDGTGMFTLVPDSGLADAGNSAVAFGDIDGDGDQDVLITGFDSSMNVYGRLYKNNGTGVFAQVTNPAIEGVQSGSANFSDIDNDGDLDLLIDGADPVYAKVAKLYKNDGIGNFTLVPDTPLTGGQYGSTAFADVNNDGFPDVLLTGYKNPYELALLYMNDGTGGFTLLEGTPFDGMTNSGIAFSDVDGDNDQDLLMTGITETGVVSRLYINTSALDVEDLQEQSISIYPNPAVKDIFIQLGDGSMADKIELYDLTGRRVFSTVQAIKADISSLPASAYLLKLYTNGKVINKKIIKQ